MESMPLGNDGCQGCPAMCCHGLEEAIIRPTTVQEVENLKWELYFVNTMVFIRNKRWYKMSTGRCRYLGQDNRCGIYDTRPQVCRDHNPPGCEFHGEIADVMFHDPTELQEYMDMEKKKRQRQAKKRAKAKGKVSAKPAGKKKK